VGTGAHSSGERLARPSGATAAAAGSAPPGPVRHYLLDEGLVGWWIAVVLDSVTSRAGPRLWPPPAGDRRSSGWSDSATPTTTPSRALFALHPDAWGGPRDGMARRGRAAFARRAPACKRHRSSQPASLPSIRLGARDRARAGAAWLQVGADPLRDRARRLGAGLGVRRADMRLTREALSSTHGQEEVGPKCEDAPPGRPARPRAGLHRGQVREEVGAEAGGEEIREAPEGARPRQAKRRSDVHRGGLPPRLHRGTHRSRLARRRLVSRRHGGEPGAHPRGAHSRRRGGRGASHRRAIRAG
jgi:hypothetical protein